MTVTIPNIIHCSELLSTFRQLPGNSEKTKRDLYEFLIQPTPERDSFLAQYTYAEYVVQNKISTKNLRPI